jgi:hypothetical protein
MENRPAAQRILRFHLGERDTIPIQLNEEELAKLERLVEAQMKPTRRQEETAPLHNGAVVMIVPQTRDDAIDEPWRATIRSFQDDALYREYTETLKARRGDLVSEL